MRFYNIDEEIEVYIIVLEFILFYMILNYVFLVIMLRDLVLLIFLLCIKRVIISKWFSFLK